MSLAIGTRLATSGRLYRRLLAARVRSDWQYRTSFVIFFVAQSLITSLDLAAVLLVLELVPSLGGWDSGEVLFLYGMATVPFDLSILFVGSLDRVSTYVRQGEFDRLLLRPVSAILQLSAGEFELRRLGRLVPSVTVMIWALSLSDLGWRPGPMLILVAALGCGTLIYCALWIGTAATSFWTVESLEAVNAVTYGGEFANEYPLHVYPGWIRAVLGWIVPLAWVAYVPSLVLLDAANPLGIPSVMLLAAGPVAVTALAVSLLIWRTGVRRYQSTGS